MEGTRSVTTGDKIFMLSLFLQACFGNVCVCVTREQMCTEHNDHTIAVLTGRAVLRVIFYSVDVRHCWGREMGPVL